MFTFFFSLFIESAQYFVGRSTDIDDLLLNTFGGILGALVFLIIRRTSFARKITESR
ncbi:MAG: VanZ family protein [Clostridiales bacterium]|nr:VanZ family protein [Clostridiales bacterium]